MYTFPLVSRPMIIDILGFSCNCATEFVVPGNFHLRRLKSDMPNQVSSRFNKVFPASSSWIIFIANCCRNTRFFYEFPWMEIGTSFLYLILSTSLIIYLIRYSLAEMSIPSIITFYTDFAESMKTFILFISIIVSEMVYYSARIESLWLMSSSMKFLLFYAFLQRADTKFLPTWWCFATSLYI